MRTTSSLVADLRDPRKHSACSRTRTCSRLHSLGTDPQSRSFNWQSSSPSWSSTSGSSDGGPWSDRSDGQGCGESPKVRLSPTRSLCACGPHLLFDRHSVPALLGRADVLQEQLARVIDPAG